MQGSVILTPLRVVGEFVLGVDGDMVANAPYEFALPKRLTPETISALIEDIAQARVKAQEGLAQILAQMEAQQQQGEMLPPGDVPVDGVTQEKALAGVEG
jgi:hypothetical protein